MTVDGGEAVLKVKEVTEDFNPMEEVMKVSF